MLKRLHLPREHGGWAVLIAPLAVGFAAAGAFPARAPALIAAALGLFLARAPFLELVQGRGGAGAKQALAAYLTLAAAGSAGLLGSAALPVLLALAVPAALAGLIHVRFTLTRRPMHPVNELVGVAALTLGAPAAYAVAHGGLDARAGGAWALSLLFFLGPLLHVRSMIRGGAPARRRSVAYHAAACAAVAALAAAAAVPAAAVVPFLAALAKTSTARPRPVREIGLLELAHSVFFAVWTGAVYLF